MLFGRSIGGAAAILAAAAHSKVRPLSACFFLNLSSLVQAEAKDESLGGVIIENTFTRCLFNVLFRRRR